MSETNQHEDCLEQDSRFPSGPWKGFFLQPHLKSGRSWMDLHLSFSNGSMRGEGRDWVGSFIITGRYELDGGKCWWTKRYIGKHDVAYQGYNEGKGIWGLWEIPPTWKGGFHIWPVAMGDPNLDKLTESIEEPSLVSVGTTETEPLFPGFGDSPP